MRTNFVLIDFESVQPDSLAARAPGQFKVLLFVGANQTKVSLELAAALQRMGDKAEYIKITGTGPNALDFHIAFYIGHLAAQDPTAYFYIVSKDIGFDPLVQHLRSRKLLSARVAQIDDLLMVKTRATQLPDIYHREADTAKSHETPHRQSADQRGGNALLETAHGARTDGGHRRDAGRRLPNGQRRQGHLYRRQLGPGGSWPPRSP